MTTRRFFVPAALMASLASPAFAQELAPAAEAPPAGEQPSPQPEAPVNEAEVDPTPSAPAPEEPVAPPPVVTASAPPRPLLRAEAPITDAEKERPEPDDGLLGSHQTHFSLQLGVRTSFISDPGFDLFSEDDVFQGMSLSAGRVLVTEGPLSLAALVGGDFSGNDATARGAKSALFQHRYWLGGEARYHLLSRLYVFVRLAPALLNTKARLSDPVAQVEREAGGLSFGADGSAGAAIELLGKASGHSSTPRGWVTADGGYSWSESDALSFSASEDDSAPTRTASLEVGDLALRGGFFRVGIAVTF